MSLYIRYLFNKTECTNIQAITTMIAVTVSIVDEIANERLIDGSNTAVVIGLNLSICTYTVPL